MRGELRNASVGQLASWSAPTALEWFAKLGDELARLQDLNEGGLSGQVLLAHLHAGPAAGGPLVYLRLVRLNRALDDLLEDLEPVAAAIFEGSEGEDAA